MSYVLHHVVIVTSFSADRITAAYQKACQLNLQVLGPAISKVNGYHTFVVCPDGSKEGWSESDRGDSLREEFLTYLKTLRDEDGSPQLEWCCVMYGNDGERGAWIVADAWEHLPQDAEEEGAL